MLQKRKKAAKPCCFIIMTMTKHFLEFSDNPRFLHVRMNSAKLFLTDPTQL